MAFDYVLFDLDGTLTNPYEGISKSVQYALQSFGITENDENALKRFIGPPLWKSFADFYGFPEEKAKEAVIKYRERYNKIGVYENKLIDGVPETLKLLHDSGKKLFLATSKPLELAKIVLDYFDIKKYFDFLGGADFNFGRDEKWQVIEYVFDSTGIFDRQSAVIVGDRMHDIIGAKRTGIKSIGVLCGFGDSKELTEYGADYIADRFCDIAPIILE